MNDLTGVSLLGALITGNTQSLITGFPTEMDEFTARATGIRAERGVGFTANEPFRVDWLQKLIDENHGLVITGPMSGTEYVLRLKPGTLTSASVDATVVRVNGRQLTPGTKLEYVLENDNGKITARVKK